jgi:hypothetical protein
MDMRRAAGIWYRLDGTEAVGTILASFRAAKALKIRIVSYPGIAFINMMPIVVDLPYFNDYPAQGLAAHIEDAPVKSVIPPVAGA